MARRKGLTRHDVEEALADFLLTSSDLSEKAWFGRTMSSGSVAKILDADNFSHAACSYAAQHAPDDVVYTWPICPTGKRHKREFYFRGTRAEWSTGECPVCRESRARREDWEANAPTFRERYPHAVQYLANSSDAEGRSGMLTFACTSCGESMSWSPRSASPPCCSWCQAADGAQPGALVLRAGGGQPVKFETQLTAELTRCGFIASSDHGIVTERGTYIVPVIKPDIVLPELQLAIEVDNTPSNEWVHNRHNDLEGVADDQQRDQLLGALGWAVLRIRRPEQPTVAGWPWRVETRSQSPRKVASLIAGALEKS